MVLLVMNGLGLDYTVLKEGEWIFWNILHT